MKIGLVGCGKTGQMVRQIIEDTADMDCVGIISSKHLKDLSSLSEKPDAVIDFSHPSNLTMIEEYTNHTPVPLVLGTTGYDAAQIGRVRKLSEKMPVVYTANFSLGITVFRQVLQQITPVLKDSFDIELIEKHHKGKLDAPSGTAKMLLAALDDKGTYHRVYGREGIGKRGEEIGIHSIRGGTIAGEHTVLYAGDEEEFEITHRAGSNRIFANGALLAARFAVGKPPGLYDMNDVLFS